jgi:hypothetical protein
MTNKQREQINIQKMEELTSILSEYGIEVKNYETSSQYLNIPPDIKYKGFYIPAKEGRKGVTLYYIPDANICCVKLPTYSFKVGYYASVGNWVNLKSNMEADRPLFFDILNEKYVKTSAELPEDKGGPAGLVFHTLEEAVKYLVENFGN